VSTGDPEDSTLLFDVWVLANSTRALLDRTLRASGLSAEEFAQYSAIRRAGSISPTELATIMGLAPTTISSSLARLERRGHIRRTPNPSDARSYQIQLTPAGLRAHRHAAELFAPVLRDVKSALPMSMANAQSALAALSSAVGAAIERR
jgi:DNA-binding MarR family transcriptional regulator